VNLLIAKNNKSRAIAKETGDVFHPEKAVFQLQTCGEVASILPEIRELSLRKEGQYGCRMKRSG